MASAKVQTAPPVQAEEYDSRTTAIREEKELLQLCGQLSVPHGNLTALVTKVSAAYSLMLGFHALIRDASPAE